MNVMTPRDGDGQAYRLPFVGPPYQFELGPIRPPSEGQDRSLLIRVNRNCPWNRCLFCTTYKQSRFEYRGLADVKADIAVVKAIADGLKGASWALGMGGRITQQVIGAVVRGTPEVYGRAPGQWSPQDGASQEDLTLRLHNLSTVANWLASGARTVFLQDANAPIMRVPELIEVLRCLRATFPSIERVTSYARAKTISQRSTEDLKGLAEAGLSRLHIGLESGCDSVLVFMDKGVTGDQHIAAGRKVKAAGMELSEYYMPGLGGRRWSREHAVDSALVLSAIDPDFIRLRSLIVRGGSDLDRSVAAGAFGEISEDEMVEEIGLFVEHLDCHAMLVSDQMSNLLPEVEGRLPEDKPKILDVIARYRALPPFDRLGLRLQRRLRSYLAVRGTLEPVIDLQVDAAIKAIENQSPDAGQKVDRVIAMLKQGYV